MERARHAAQQLVQWYGTFRNHQLAQMLGVSRQRCTVILRQLVECGELERVGSNQSSKYRAGPGAGASASGVVRGADARSLWREVAHVLPWFAYVNASLGNVTELRTRQQARNLIAEVELRQWLVVDLSGIDSMTLAFAEELLFANPFRTHEPIILNARDALADTLERARRKKALRLARVGDEPPSLPRNHPAYWDD